MENYKKRNINFVTFQRGNRTRLRNSERGVSRYTSFALLRPMAEENNPDMQKNQVEMLQKWKQIKMLKKQINCALKQPPFKVGIAKPLPLPSKFSRPRSQIPAKSNIGKCIAKSCEISTSKSQNLITEKPTKNMKEIDKNSTKVVAKKSFAPEGFMFHSPVELNSSLFLDEGPSSIFARLKSQMDRTSTSKQNVVDQLEAQQSYSRYKLFNPENVNNPVTFTLDSEKEDTAKLNDCKPSLKSESTDNSTAQKEENRTTCVLNFDSASPVENLMDGRRPPLFSSLDEDKDISKQCQRDITYDFDRLSLETEEITQPRSTRSQNVSLLYSPRKSVFRKPIKGDLMSFSPD